MLKYESLCLIRFKAITARKFKIKKGDSIRDLREILKKSHRKYINNSVLPSFIWVSCKIITSVNILSDSSIIPNNPE